MSDAKLWIDEVGCTATITGTNVSYTMPLWVLDVIRDIIGAEAEKKVEVTHRDFDTQQELLDRYRAENAKLREDLEDQEGYDQMLRDRLRQQTELCVKAEAENAKLRELVRELWTYAEQELDCDETCSYGAVCDWKDCVLTRRMRELGVEVDG